MNRAFSLSCIVLTILSPVAISQDAKPLSVSAALPLRNIGPCLTPGRVGDIAVHPKNKAVWWVAMASGGVWKTTNAGQTFQPVFDNYGSFSIGCITVDPKNPDTLWVGTGENQAQRSVGFGDGLYKSTDGGETWTNVGLKNSEHISKILIDPNDSNIVYVASQGPLWNAGGDRGLFKTTDGGKTWNNVLNISKNTGITEVVMDPRDSKILIASSYQRRRNVGVLIGGGPESGIHKSTDAGKTWKRITQGLPETNMGRIALAISPQKPDVVYALLNTAKDSNFYRSDDLGETWEKRVAHKVLDWQYMGEIIADPHTFDRVWIMDLGAVTAEDGGKRIQRYRWNVHSDHHALWIDPDNAAHKLSGNDGGLYETWDDGKSWNHFLNLPTTQYYRVGVDDSAPFYNVYGGTQDNGSSGGPHRSINAVGVRTTDWYTVGGGDGFQVRVEPGNPNILYGLSQNGVLYRVDLESGSSQGIAPRSTRQDRIRWHWDTPLMISPHNPKQVYVGGNKLFSSPDRGNTWKAISGDLTRDLDPAKIPVMDSLWEEDAVSRNTYTTTLSVCTALAESPLKKGLLYFGTDDGLLQVTQDSGETWTKIDKFADVPANSYITDVCASPNAEGTVYVTFNNWQIGDYQAYVLRSKDYGKTWENIGKDLPKRQPLWTVLEDPVHPKLLFVGSEFGLFVSTDAGQNWEQLTNGLPNIAVRDMEIHNRDHDLVIATFGRGFYVLDDLTALRQLDQAKATTLLPARKTYNFVEKRFARDSGTFTTPNPTAGVLLTYQISEKPKAELKLQIEDLDGKPIRTLTVEQKPGIYRTNWDMRAGRRSMVTSGKYQARLVQTVDDKVVTVGEVQTLELVPLP